MTDPRWLVRTPFMIRKNTQIDASHLWSIDKNLTGKKPMFTQVINYLITLINFWFLSHYKKAFL
jgi:hypothetical protein